MQHHPVERNQLATLHDRHKRFSIEVYDQNKTSETKKSKQAQKKKLYP